MFCIDAVVLIFWRTCVLTSVPKNQHVGMNINIHNIYIILYLYAYMPTYVCSGTHAQFLSFFV